MAAEWRFFMIEKNKTYTTEITGVGEKGEGIGRIEGFAVFIPMHLWVKL